MLRISQQDIELVIRHFSVKWKVREVYVYVPRVIELGKVCIHSSFQFWHVKYYYNYHVYVQQSIDQHVYIYNSFCPQ